VSTHGWVDTALLGGAAYGALSTNKSVQRNTALLGAKLDFQTFAMLYPEEAKAHLARAAQRAAAVRKFKQATAVLAFTGFILLVAIVNIVNPTHSDAAPAPHVQAAAYTVTTAYTAPVVPTYTAPVAPVATAAPVIMSCPAILADAKQNIPQPIYQNLQRDYNHWSHGQTSHYKWDHCYGAAISTIGLWAGR
jgi:hypothetical protein